MPVQQDTDPRARDRVGHDYRTLLVHVQPGLAGAHRVELAAGLARRFGARLVGLGAETYEPISMLDPYSGQLVAEMYQQLARQVKADLANAETAFRRDAAGADLEWRVVDLTPVKALAQAARAADLIVVTADEGKSGDIYNTADPSEVILTAGRPVLVAPPGDGHLRADKILVAWKDTREARRAVADALPFLTRAEDVLVLAISGDEGAEAARAAVEDVAEALRRHGAPARSAVTGAPDASVADELNAEAAAMGADLIVAGAYGHSRTVEWVLGGATRALMRRPQRYLLLSH
ncbi:universal stress protein [Phenylobacterium sp.]|uniref:universal stress protein n=1 Tax=Phenylobacterium sp. TaxID=1871053 RepID=UPI0035AEB215